jgi:hypothetical protein
VRSAQRRSCCSPAPINLTQEFPAGSTVFTGQATNISLTLDDARGCHAVVGAKILAGGGPGFTGLDVKQFDRIDLGGFGDSIADSSAIISPAQRISSP